MSNVRDTGLVHVRGTGLVHVRCQGYRASPCQRYGASPCQRYRVRFQEGTNLTICCSVRAISCLVMVVRPKNWLKMEVTGYRKSCSTNSISWRNPQIQRGLVTILRESRGVQWGTATPLNKWP